MIKNYWLEEDDDYDIKNNRVFSIETPLKFISSGDDKTLIGKDRI